MDTITAANELLDEARWLEIEIDPGLCTVSAKFQVLTLPSDNVHVSDPVIELRFRDVGRLAVSLLRGPWSNPTASVASLELQDLSEAHRSFGGLPVFNGHFFDLPEEEFAKWSGRLALDWHPASGDSKHSVNLSQEAPDRHLDAWIWFDELDLLTEEGYPAPISELVHSNRRWWKAMKRGDAEATDKGIMPLDSE